MSARVVGQVGGKAATRGHARAQAAYTGNRRVRDAFASMLALRDFGRAVPSHLGRHSDSTSLQLGAQTQRLQLNARTRLAQPFCFCGVPPRPLLRTAYKLLLAPAPLHADSMPTHGPRSCGAPELGGRRPAAICRGVRGASTRRWWMSRTHQVACWAERTQCDISGVLACTVPVSRAPGLPDPACPDMRRSVSTMEATPSWPSHSGPGGMAGTGSLMSSALQ